MIFWLAAALAQEPKSEEEGATGAITPEQIERGVGVEPFGEPPTSEAEIVGRTMALAHRLRCPVCQGLSVADSTSDAALGMKARITELVKLGYTDDQIKDYFADRYGTWILLAPPQAQHELLWILPWGGAFVALVAIGWSFARKAPVPPTKPPEPPKDDPYRDRVLQELGE